MRKIVALILVASLTLPLPFFNTKVKAEGEDVKNTSSDSLLFDHIKKENSYDEYLKKYSSKPMPEQEIIIPAVDFSGSEGEPKVLNGFEGVNSSVLEVGDSGYVEWKVNIPEDALYNMSIKYYPVEGKSSDIERKLLIDGKLPFNEASIVLFQRVWKDKGKIDPDNQGHDRRPSQIEAPMWVEATVRDSEELHYDSFKFFFSKGEHVIRLESVREPMVIDSIKLFQEKSPKTYAEVKKEYASKGYKNATDVIKLFQAEQTYLKSDPTLFPLFDRSNPLNQPYDYQKITLNYIGGYNWRRAGQWMSWKINVPEDGLYNIGMKFRQNTVVGIPVTRSFEIDGKLPFKEAGSVQFDYDTEWQMKTLGPNNGDPYLFYLTKGEHEIKMRMNLGKLSEVIRNVQQTSIDLTQMYTRIVMLTGQNPDYYRDYGLDTKIPDLLKVFEDNAKYLREQVKNLKALAGSKVSEAVILERMAFQLENMVEDPHTIHQRLNNYKDNLQSLSSWVLLVREQPIDIDYFVVASKEKEMPKAKPNFFEKFIFNIKSFFISFFTDYNVIGDKNNKDDAVNVWTMLGRDQANTLKAMIDESFTKDTGIKVNLNLINNEGIMLFAEASGEGPDVGLNVSRTTPINYGIRNALVDLSKLEGFDEVKNRFMPTAITPYSYDGKVYGIPQTQSFSMMFYRKDILSKLELGVPQTWDDVAKVIAEVEENNLQFAPGGDMFGTFILQNGGSYYNEEQSRAILDDPIGINAFKEWTNFYTLYGLPLYYDFFNRFRDGLMPIGIADYTLYNQLSVAAPQIKGLWDIAPIPGTVKADGTIDRSTTAGGSSIVLFKNSDKIDKAWKFVEWWTRTETQVRYGRELEALMGTAARYNTANVEAMSQLAWPKVHYDKLMEQWKEVKEIPIIPGSYFVDRHIGNAFNEVVVGGEIPRESLTKFVREMNNEIKKKREEFGLE